MIILIDDLRSFLDGRTAETARTSTTGIALLTRHRDRHLDELWLDHDLGDDDTIWPVIELLERAAFEEHPFDIGIIVIHSANPAGAARMTQALQRWNYPVRTATGDPAVGYTTAISGWQAHYLPAPTQLHSQRAALQALVGQSLQTGWTGSDPARNVRQPELPVVLRFDGGAQLELAWQRGDDLSITWNTIDLSIPPTLAGIPHQWRTAEPPALAAVTGHVLTGWTATEDPYFDGEQDLTGELPMHAVAGWTVQGLCLRFGERDLHVHSGADNTYVSAGYTAPTRAAPDTPNADAGERLRGP